MLIYIVSLKNKRPCGADGVWGAYTTLEKAREAVEGWIKEYEEQLLNMEETYYASWHYYTNNSEWIIDGTILAK